MMIKKTEARWNGLQKRDASGKGFAQMITNNQASVNIFNNDFMNVIFGSEPSLAKPVVVSFRGNPNDVPPGMWAARPWVNSTMDDDANNYFSISIFNPNADGRYHRRKANFNALNAIVLDDVGTKIPVERVTLPATWQLETSPGNFQVGYLLNEPLSDGKTANRLMGAVIEAGLCDPGASGPMSRLARLPVGVNGKHTPPFRCRMTSWEPDRRYSVQELVDNLQIDMTKKRAARRGTAEATAAGDGGGVWTPRPSENPVLKALMERGLYKGPLGERKHDITCPWCHEHTDAIDCGTAYFEPDSQYPIGGFRCLHGHCSGRRVGALLNFLGVSHAEARMKPLIRAVAGELLGVLDATEREMAATGKYFQRGGKIVQVIRDPGNGEAILIDVGPIELEKVLAGVATWEKFDGRTGEFIRIDPPPKYAQKIHGSSEYKHLPLLRGIIRHPYLSPEGGLSSVRGYDPVTCLYGVFDPADFNISEDPTRADALLALSLLEGVLSEFAFKTDVDRSAAVCAILTAAVRQALPGAPMFCVTAHDVGSGKSFLNQVIKAFATPRVGTTSLFPPDNEECKKALLAILRQSPAVVDYDNLVEDIPAFASLCNVLTTEFFEDRILGVSESLTVGTRTLFLASGNNVGPTQDMARRCVTIHLCPDVEFPALRTFKRPDLVQEILCDRGRYVSAALTIIKAWFSAGRQHAPCKALSGFEPWSDLCRQPLLWLGLPDPAKSVFDALADDPTRSLLGRLLDQWQRTFGRDTAMVRDVMRILDRYREEDAELREVVAEIAEERGEINRLVLGRWIKRHTGRIVDGRRFVKADIKSNAASWKVEVV